MIRLVCYHSTIHLKLLLQDNTRLNNLFLTFGNPRLISVNYINTKRSKNAESISCMFDFRFGILPDKWAGFGSDRQNKLPMRRLFITANGPLPTIYEIMFRLIS